MAENQRAQKMLTEMGKRLAAKIDAFREQIAVSNAEAARILGLDPSTLYHLRRDDNNGLVVTKIAIVADRCGLEIHQLLDEETAIDPKNPRLAELLNERERARIQRERDEIRERIRALEEAERAADAKMQKVGSGEQKHEPEKAEQKPKEGPKATDVAAQTPKR